MTSTTIATNLKKKPDPDCSLCGGTGSYFIGNSGSEADGNGAQTEECDCFELVEEPMTHDTTMNESAEILDCPNCPNRGWFVNQLGHQEPCEFCYREPRSRFNVEQARTAASEGVE